MPADPTVHIASVAELDPAVLYRILALRSEVFVVEQECVYLDLDGRDVEASALQLWIEDAGAVAATLRLLIDPGDVVRIGRVATAAAARGRGLAGLLMGDAVRLAGRRESVLDAQAHLHDWYARFGYVRAGADFIEDGIPHTPMRRASTGSSGAPAQT